MFDIDKARRRIKETVKTGNRQARVHLSEDKKTGYYAFKHGSYQAKFKVDSLGRTVFSGEGMPPADMFEKVKRAKPVAKPIAKKAPTSKKVKSSK